MKTFPLNPQGFITQYLVSGPLETKFSHQETACQETACQETACQAIAWQAVEKDQLRQEACLRSMVTKKQGNAPAGPIVLGENSSLGLPWRYYYDHENWFVDLSDFYPELARVEADASTQLVAAWEMKAKAVAWSYTSVDLWCNGQHQLAMEPPVYKPMQKREIQLKLKKGVNSLYIRLQTLGARDTRTLFGIQILGPKNGIRVSLPDEAHAGKVAESARWLSQAVIKNRHLVFPSPAPPSTFLGYDSQSPDFSKSQAKVERHDISGVKVEKLEAGKPYVLVECHVEGQTLARSMEDISMIGPESLKGLDQEANLAQILKRTASVESFSRGGKFGFSISNILARQATGLASGKDRQLLLETLSQIENRLDCSDFLVCGLVRYMKNYPMDKELRDRAKKALLHYRYWMDQEGSDAMCFWSENHSLMFYVSAMNVGEMYPGEYFTCAHMTGRQLHEAGKKRMAQWLEDVTSHGFEEFLSTVYMCVTFAGLLNAVDYSAQELSCLASRVTDRLLEMLAIHTYKGSIIAPMGRVYRQVIYPFLQGAQALMNLVNPQVPYSYGEGWLAFYATSKYQVPKGLAAKMNEAVSTEYATGNALVRLEKNDDYCLTSVQSPRMDPGFQRWPNLTLLEEEQQVGQGSHQYAKSINERFHGTTCFQPGAYGYQQHMWSGALDSQALVFTNHPGSTCDASQMRPGFWYGNGVMPAIRQEKGVLGAIYVIPDDHPIHFTHAFWPRVKFDRSAAYVHWLFGQKGTGFLALWCSQPMVLHQDQVFDCEYRSFGDEVAYLCICGGREQGNLGAFMEACKKMAPFYQDKRLAAGEFQMVYEKQEDRTQYV